LSGGSSGDILLPFNRKGQKAS